MVKEKDALCFQISLPESQWTKQDLFNYFNVLGNKEITETGQVISGIHFMKKTDNNISVLKAWLKVYYDDFLLATDSPSKMQNPNHFVENRHDQSIWSILVKINNLYTIPSEIYMLKNNKFIPDFPIQARRDKVKIFDIFLNKIAWWIPNKHLRDNFRKKNYSKVVALYNSFESVKKMFTNK